MTGSASAAWLAERSLELIVGTQAESGAFPASPDFSAYRYSWLRDGAFIAHALDRHGHHAYARKFHAWVASTVDQHEVKVEHLEAAVTGGEVSQGILPQDRFVLHTRFTLAGSEADAEWGNFQLDGYGFWLVGLGHHLSSTGDSPEKYRTAIETVVRYLSLMWDYPCYDCWEEYPTGRHSSTMAAVAAGLSSGARILGDEEALAVAERACAKVKQDGVQDGVLRKFVGRSPMSEETDIPGLFPVAGHERIGRPLPDDILDASALLVLGEFGPFDPDDPVIDATITAIENRLVVEGGTHRYREDEYYGGGLWVLLSGALAILQAQRGRSAEASLLVDWIVKQADSNGDLPEQVSHTLRHPEMYDVWVDRWGPISQPLLWSHAMYLLAVDALTVNG